MRRATAHIELRHFQEAVQDLTTALQYEPQNKECVSKLSSIADVQQRALRSDTSMGDRSAATKAALVVATREGWKSIGVKGNPAPPALNGHTLFCGAEQKIYLFGGRSVRDQKAQVYVMDNSDYSWDLTPTSGTPPTPRAWHSICCINDALSAMCVYGGVSSQGEDPQLHLLTSVDTNRFDWVQAPSVDGKVPDPRSGHSATSIPGATTRDVYFFGGRTKKGVSQDLYILRSTRSSGQHHSAFSWEEVRQTGAWPSPRDGHTMCALASVDGSSGKTSNLVLFGGNGQQNEEKMNDTWLFDTKTSTWEELRCVGDVPPARSYHTAHMIGSYMFVVGGRMKDTEDSDVYVLDTGMCTRLHRVFLHVGVLTCTIVDLLFVLGAQSLASGSTFLSQRTRN